MTCERVAGWSKVEIAAAKTASQGWMGIAPADRAASWREESNYL